MTQGRKPAGRRNRSRALRAWREAGGVCHLCGLPIDPDLPWPAPASLVFDHFDPVSLGGPDTFANGSCAHKRCNERRGTKPVEVARSELNPRTAELPRCRPAGDERLPNTLGWKQKCAVHAGWIQYDAAGTMEGDGLHCSSVPW